jgi:hypothetical protein
MVMRGCAGGGFEFRHRRVAATRPRRSQKRAANFHQQAGFATGTVTNDDKLSADFSHGLCVDWGVGDGQEKGNEAAEDARRQRGDRRWMVWMGCRSKYGAESKEEEERRED